MTWVNISGFNDINNAGVELIVFNNILYAAIENEVTGGKFFKYDGGSTWTQINSDGFGDKNNSGVEDDIIFNNELYITANNSVTGAEIWRYDGGTNWTRVNPGNGSFGDMNNLELWLTNFNNELYVSTENNISGVEIWRYDGEISWTRIDPGALGSENDGFGDATNTAAELLEYNGSLYASTSSWKIETEGVEVWRYDGGTSWSQINITGFGDTNNIDSDGYVFEDTLYVTTENFMTGVEIWRYNGETSWSQVNDNGFGKGSDNPGIDDDVEYNGALYLGTESNPTNANAKGEIWRYDGGTSWTDVTPPWDINNKEIEGFLVYNNYLYVGMVNSSTGGEIWKYDGTNWIQINIDGFGNPSNDEIGVTLWDNTLYAHTGNEVWQLPSSKGMPWLLLLLD